MHIVIRADASVQIGTGHIMRCLTLADELHTSSVEISFAARDLPRELDEAIVRRKYPLHRLPTSAGGSGGLDWEIDARETLAALQRQGIVPDWLIVDHYQLDERWEQRVRPFVKKIMVIDDLADRRHSCDILLDQNLYHDMKTRYDRLVPEECKRFLGPRYALLRPEFRIARSSLRRRDGAVHRILVFFGGSDPTNETRKTLEALSRINRVDVAVDVVVGSANPYKESIHQQCLRMPNMTYHYQIQNMAQLMAEADLAIGAGGSATWERCFLGLPSIMIVIANNQERIADAVAAEGATINLKRHDQVSVKLLVETLSNLAANPGRLREMSKQALRIMNSEEPGGFTHPLVRALTGRTHAEV